MMAPNNPGEQYQRSSEIRNEVGACQVEDIHQKLEEVLLSSPG